MAAIGHTGHVDTWSMVWAGIGTLFAVGFAVVISVGEPIQIRRPKRPSWSKVAKNWWLYWFLFQTVEFLTTEHSAFERRTLLIILGLVGTATVISLVRGLRHRRRPRVAGSPTLSTAVGQLAVAGQSATPTTAAAGPTLGDPTTTAVVMPWLGRYVTGATVTAIFKLPGEAVSVGEALCEVSTDKVDTEIPADVSGIVAAVLVQPPQDVAVGEPILLITPDSSH
jgi:biotin carboxyl carrier protein